MQRSTPSAGVYYIAFDFGTTFSSVSWVKHSERDAEHIMGHSPQHSFKQREVIFSSGQTQIPTQIAWHEAGHRMVYGDDVDQYIYNDQIKESSRLDYLKLGLDDSPYTQGQRDRLKSRLQSLPETCGIKTVEDAVRLFLQHLYRKCCHAIMLTEPHMSEADFEQENIVCIVCVPVLWDYPKRERMKQLAVEAKFPNVQLITEPDAAATFVINELLFENQEALRKESGDQETVVVVDLGGGTGDFATFTYWHENGIIFRNQSYRATGAACGSALLNEKMKAYVEAKLGPHWDNIFRDLQWGYSNTPGGRAKFLRPPMQRFEMLKRNFSSRRADRGSPIKLPFPNFNGRDGCPIVREFMDIPWAKLKEFFDDLLTIVIDHICRQIQGFSAEQERLERDKNHVNGIVLVGGLGGSPYVQEVLEEYFEKQRKMGYCIPVTVPASPSDQGRVGSRGALLTTLYKQAIGIRYLDCSIGFAWDEAYDERVHKLYGKEQSQFDAWDGEVMVLDRARWLFKSGERVVVQECGKRFHQGIRRFDLPEDLEGSQEVMEPIYAAMNQSEDHLNVHDPSTGITVIGFLRAPISNRVIMNLISVNRDNVLTKFRSATGSKGKKRKKKSDEYVETEYRITAELVYPLLRWTVTFPWRGKFPDRDLEDMGEDPVHLHSETNCSATFDLTRDGARPTPNTGLKGKRRRPLNK